MKSTENYKEGNELGLEIFKDIKFVDIKSKTTRASYIPRSIPELKVLLTTSLMHQPLFQPAMSYQYI